ncbi:MAG: O-antigen ligase family protein, partial [Acidimicrobiia bacterium]
EAWVSWKPFLIAVAVIAVGDLVDGIRARTWPWHRKVSLSLLVFGVAVLVGWPDSAYLERFLQLGLGLAVGVLVLLVTERRLRTPGMLDRTLGVVFWSAAAMGATAVLVELVLVGALGTPLIGAVNDIPGVYRVFKPAYLEEGFLALTNWHQDPGYSAAWSVLWAVLAFMAIFRGRGSGRWWLDGMVIGGLGFAAVMAFARTGWVSFPLAVAVAAVMVVRRWHVPIREVAIRLAVSVVTIVVLVGGVWAVDTPGEGGDLDLQFAFRASQGWDLLATATGWFQSSEDFSDRFAVSEERADVWPEYWAFFVERPLTGVGLGVGWLTTSISQEPHNLFLELAGETGLLGLIGFGLVLGTVLVAGGGIVGGVALFAAFLHSITQTVLFEPTWWFAAGIYLAGSTAMGTRGSKTVLDSGLSTPAGGDN